MAESFDHLKTIGLRRVCVRRSQPAESVVDPTGRDQMASIVKLAPHAAAFSGPPEPERR